MTCPLMVTRILRLPLVIVIPVIQTIIKIVKPFPQDRPLGANNLKGALLSVAGIIREKSKAGQLVSAEELLLTLKLEDRAKPEGDE